MPRRLEIGDEVYVWDDPEKLREFKERVEKVKEEIKEKKKITFHMEEWYQRNRSPKIKLFYKNVITKFKTLEMGGAPIYKPHYISFVPYRTNEGELRSRCITSNSEEIAFLDMKKGFIREEDIPLTPLQKKTIEAEQLQAKLDKLEAKEKTDEKEEDTSMGKIVEEDKLPQVKRGPGRPKKSIT